MRIGKLILLTSLVSFSAFGKECSLEPLTAGVRLMVKEGNTVVHKRIFVNIREAARERDTMVREGECTQAKIKYHCTSSTENDLNQVQFRLQDMSISMALQYSHKDNAVKALTEFLDVGVCRLGQYEVCTLDEKEMFIQLGRKGSKDYFYDLASGREKLKSLVESGLCPMDESQNECRLEVQEGFVVTTESGSARSIFSVDGIKEGIEQLSQMEKAGECKIKKSNYECSTYLDDGYRYIDIKKSEFSSWVIGLMDDENINDYLTSGLCRSISEVAAKNGLIK